MKIDEDTKPKIKKPDSTGTNPTVKPSQMKTQKIPVPLVRADLMALTGDLAGRRFTVESSKTMLGRLTRSGATGHRPRNRSSPLTRPRPRRY